MNKPKLLIVNNIPENCGELYRALIDEYDIFNAASGDEALMSAKSLAPDLILTDVKMPEMDGYELCAALKQNSVTMNIPVIFTIARTDTESELRALAAGAMDFIHKPFNAEVVRTRVRHQLELVQHRKRLEELNRQFEQSLADIKLSQSQLEVLSTAIEQSPTSVVITGENAIIQYVNPRFCAESGYSFAEAIGENPRMLNSGLTEAATFQEMWGTLQRGEPWVGEFINRRKTGEIYWEEAHIAPVKDAEGTTTHYVAVKLDISERKETQRRLAYMAHHDALTDLPNRTLFFDLFAQGLSLAKRNQTRLALMYIDLDRFKEINDTFGHAVGDQVLLEAAARMSGCVRDSDSVGRVGGDEFLVLLQEVGSEDAAVMVGDKIRTSLNQPFIIGDTTLSISASIGIALYPEQGCDVNKLARNADIAMYHVKEHVRNKVCVFTESMIEAASGFTIL